MGSMRSSALRRSSTSSASDSRRMRAKSQPGWTAAKQEAPKKKEEEDPNKTKCPVCKVKVPSSHMRVVNQLGGNQRKEKVCKNCKDAEQQRIYTEQCVGNLDAALQGIELVTNWKSMNFWMDSWSKKSKSSTCFINSFE